MTFVKEQECAEGQRRGKRNGEASCWRVIMHSAPH